MCHGPFIAGSVSSRSIMVFQPTKHLWPVQDNRHQRARVTTASFHRKATSLPYVRTAKQGETPPLISDRKQRQKEHKMMASITGNFYCQHLFYGLRRVSQVASKNALPVVVSLGSWNLPTYPLEIQTWQHKIIALKDYFPIKKSI